MPPETVAYIRSIDYPCGTFLPRREARVSADDRGFAFADGVYEVFRAYGGRLFELDAHLRRLQRSLAAVRIAFGDAGSAADLCRELLERNRLAESDALLYLQITRGASPRAHPFPSEDVAPTVWATAASFAGRTDEQRSGISVIVVPDQRWLRCDIKSVSLLPNILAKQQAVEAGSGEAVFVRDGVVTEASASNVFAVIDGVVRTHPLTNAILPGVTREVVIELARSEGLALREDPFGEEELWSAGEAFITSTTAEVIPVVRVGNTQISDGAPGPVTRALQRAFRRRV